MSDIFISYSKKDRDRAKTLAGALEAMGWSVFWDRKIPAGLTWRQFIGKELAEARCIVVIWSQASVGSEWVLEEAEIGKKKNILIPAFVEAVEPPFGFAALQGADFSTWDGNADASTFRQFVTDMERIIGPPPSQVEEEEATAKDRVEKEKPLPAGAELVPTVTRPPAKALAAWIRTHLVSALVMAAVLILAAGWTVWKVSRAPYAVQVADAKRGDGAPDWAADEALNRRILIEGGEFMTATGSDLTGEDNQPVAKLVTVPSFFIQEHEVTNEEYRRFDQKHHFEPGKNRYPVVRIPCWKAEKYAKWLGGRLPTRTEWEYAARGAEGRTYPWGEAKPTCDLANYKGCGEQIKEVGSHENGKTPEGVHDLAGNVREWVGGYGGESRPLRGGSFLSDPMDLRSDRPDSGHVEFKLKDIGFRVAWRVPRKPD